MSTLANSNSIFHARKGIKRSPGQIGRGFWSNYGLLNGILQSLTGLECGGLGCGDLNRSAGGRILAGAGSTLFDLKGTKAHQLYFIAALHSVLDRIQNGVKSNFAVFLGKSAGFSYGIDQFGLFMITLLGCFLVLPLQHLHLTIE